MRTIKVEVTQRDIDNGKRCSGTTCPVARAINRKLKKKIAIVGPDYVYLYRNKEIKLNKRIQNWIINFDHRNYHGTIKPITFNLTY